MSAKVRLFLTIERLKNNMDDSQMRLPYWEQFFPLFGDAQSVNIDIRMLSDLINEAGVAAENRLVTQSGAIYSQYINDGVTENAPAPALRLPLRRIEPVTKTAPLNNLDDSPKYASVANKMMNYFASAGVSSVPFRVRDVIMLYLYTASLPKFKPLFTMIDSALFRSDHECTPVYSSSASSLILDNLRDLTGITNIRLDYDSLIHINVSIQKAVNNELSKYPVIKVKDYCSLINVYDKITEPCKAYLDKFSMLIAQKVQYEVRATPFLNLCHNPVIIENVVISVEKSSDMNRMVYNAVNNIFINAVEQCAIENIKFDVDDYCRRFKLMDRVREVSKNNVVEKEAAGDVVSRKRLRTLTNTSTDTKRYKIK
ncbi:hypothetical protein SlGVgp075 [Spodoptera litura granulovirus]|uniref:P40 n=1 Tax=Spodoptera litura granulovirus TaxID=359919 RepID=A5IZS7_9BBAC|nr:hypothetical protein SlGVgp075 [Spodoptera litura granulovirus]ABQ52018.1 hypothetical protein SlGVgp075 [Spodoptera litura granulovirus]